MACKGVLHAEGAAAKVILWGEPIPSLYLFSTIQWSSLIHLYSDPVNTCNIQQGINVTCFSSITGTENITLFSMNDQ